MGESRDCAPRSEASSTMRAHPVSVVRIRRRSLGYFVSEAAADPHLAAAVQTDLVPRLLRGADALHDGVTVARVDRADDGVVRARATTQRALSHDLRRHEVGS